MAAVPLVVLATYSGASCDSPAPGPVDPVAEIAGPADGSTFRSGRPLTLVGVGTDPQDGPLTGPALSWTSSLAGPLGTGSPISPTLSVGQHAIVLVVTDSDGNTGEDRITLTVTPDSPPSVEIQQPADGATILARLPVSFAGAGTDPEDGDLPSDRLEWTSSRDGEIGTGTAFSRSDLSVGEHSVSLMGTDSDGNTAVDVVRITIEPNTDPVVTIESPQDGDVVLARLDVSFQGSGTDAEDGPLAGGALQWTSDLDGSIGSGTTFTRNDLSVGTHRITLTATDSHGNVAEASTSLTVEPNTDPVATILAPADGHSVFIGTAVTFSGSGTDAEDGALSGSALQWTSNIDGGLGSGASVTTSALSGGSHQVTLSVTDSHGNVTVASITVVIDPGAIPVPVISAPANGASVGVGSSVTFSGSATDVEDGALSGPQLQWTSSIDGSIGSGASFSTSSLSLGTHAIVLTATDSHGNRASAQIGLTVQVPAALAYVVNSTAPGTVTVLDVGTSLPVGSPVGVGNGPNGVAFTPDGSRAYVTNGNSNSVSIIDVGLQAVVGTIPVGNTPTGVVFNASGSRAYVANFNGNDVSVIDVGTSSEIGSRIPVGTGASDLVLTPNGARLYVTGFYGKSFTAIDVATSTPITTGFFGSSAQGLDVSPDGSTVFVACKEKSWLCVVDVATNTVSTLVPMGSSPSDIAIRPDGTRGYMTNKIPSGTVTVFDPTSYAVLATIPVGSNPNAIDVNAAGTRAIVANQVSNTVSIIDLGTNTVIVTIPVGTGPVAAAFR